jgi:hypothetical protein
MMTSGEEEGSDGQKRAEAQWDVIDMISLRRSNLRESLALSLVDHVLVAY